MQECEPEIVKDCISLAPELSMPKCRQVILRKQGRRAERRRNWASRSGKTWKDGIPTKVFWGHKHFKYSMHIHASIYVFHCFSWSTTLSVVYDPKGNKSDAVYESW